MLLELYGNLKNPRVLVIGVFHGDEPQGDYLIRKYLKENKDTNLLMLPCLNKTGFINKTRVNSNGVDLNRNFPTKNWELSVKNEYYGGLKPASEIETKELIQIIDKYAPKAILSLHAPYKVVNYDGGNDTQNSGLKLAQNISKIMGYPVEDNIGYPTPGSFGTWAGIERNIPTITLELDEDTSVSTLKSPVFEVFKMLENY